MLTTLILHLKIDLLLSSTVHFFLMLVSSLFYINVSNLLTIFQRHYDVSQQSQLYIKQNTDLFKEANDIIADLCQADNDVVDVDVVERGVVSAFSSCLVQNQVPAVH